MIILWYLRHRLINLFVLIKHIVGGHLNQVLIKNIAEPLLISVDLLVIDKQRVPRVTLLCVVY